LTGVEERSAVWETRVRMGKRILVKYKAFDIHREV